MGKFDSLKTNLGKLKEDVAKQRQVWYLPKPWILEELYSRKLVLFAMGAICCALFLMLVWASIAKIDESATATGEIVPVGNIRIVQHLEGGIVDQLFVNEGSFVKKGQPLLQLNDIASKSELRQLESREADLMLDAERLTAYTENVALKDDKLKPNQKAYLQEQALLALQKKARADQMAIASAQVNQKAKEIQRLGAQIRLSTDSLKLLKEEEFMYATLVKDGPVSRRDYLRIQRERISAEKELFNFRTEYEKSKEALSESESERRRVLSTLNETAAKELDDIRAELKEVAQAIIKLRDRVSRSTVQAPATGLIKGLEATVGKVIPANGEILTIVPQNTRLQIMARVQPKDIGHIKVNDAAVVKVMAYDFSRYGTIKGTVAALSATTFLDEKERPYYRAVILLKSQFVNHPGNKLRTGMTAQVDITTGSKTILQYLLKPIHVTLKNSLRER